MVKTKEVNAKMKRGLVEIKHEKKLGGEKRKK